jgi:Zn-dependent protease with chaperone function
MRSRRSIQISSTSSLAWFAVGGLVVEREAALLVVSLAICGVLCMLFGALAPPLEHLESSGRRAEKQAWRRLWLPLAPAGFALMLLLGWAVQEPDDTDDGVAMALLLAAVPGAIIAARAIARATTSVMKRGKPLAATVGFVRPRVIIDEAVCSALDAEALAAVHAHEQAHARHRDPLRIWIAQLAADLQWPSPSAPTRFRQWLHALEVARDEEAREGGVDGDALASAIVTVAQLAKGRTQAYASLVGQGDLLRDRIARLLQPMVPDGDRDRVSWIVVTAFVAIGLGLGAIGGDHLLRCIPGIT